MNLTARVAVFSWSIRAGVSDGKHKMMGAWFAFLPFALTCCGWLPLQPFGEDLHFTSCFQNDAQQC